MAFANASTGPSSGAARRNIETNRFLVADRWLACGIYSVNLILHFILLRHPPPAFFYNLDEADVTFSCLDRFLGLPSTTLMEPSSVLQMFSVPLFLLDFVIRRGLAGNQLALLGSFSSYLADSYADPRHHVTLVRALVAAIACLGPALLFAICRRLEASRVISAFCALALLVQPAFFYQSLMAAGDSAGLTAMLCALTVLLYGNSDRWVALASAGLLQSMAISFKLTMASSTLIVLAFLCFHPAVRSRRVTQDLQFAAGLLAGFLLWCPYIWVEPLRFAKAVFGNINRPGSHADVYQFLYLLQESAGAIGVIVAAVLVIASVVVFLVSPAKDLVIALLCCLVLMAVPLFFRATTAHSRYFMPLVLPPLLCFVTGIRGLERYSSSRILTAVLGVVVVAMALTLARSQAAIHGPDDLVDALRAEPRIPAGGKIYVPEDAGTIYALRLPRTSYVRISARAKEELYGGRGVTMFLLQNGIPEKAIRTLVTNFNEKEQANATRTAVAAESEVSSDRDVFLYRAPHSTDSDLVFSRVSWAEVDLAKALETLQSKEPVALLVKLDATPPRAGKRVWQGRQWAWYTNESAAIH